MRLKDIRSNYKITTVKLQEVTGIHQARISDFQNGKISLRENEFFSLVKAVHKLTGERITGVGIVRKYVPVDKSS